MFPDIRNHQKFGETLQAMKDAAGAPHIKIRLNEDSNLDLVKETHDTFGQTFGQLHHGETANGQDSALSRHRNQQNFHKEQRS